MKNVRAIFFDLDGTLFDLDPLVHAARGRVADLLHQNGFFASRSYALRRINDLERRHGPYYSSSPYYFAFYDIAKALFGGKPKKVEAFLKKYAKGFSEDSDPIESFVAELEHVYNIENVEAVKPYPDTLNTLNELREAGYRLFLVTLGRTVRQKNKIDRLGIEPLFDKVINEGPPSHDYWFSELLKDYKLTPEEVACVGDRTHDEIRSGNRLGCVTVWMRRGRFADEDPAEGDRPDHQIRFLAQLPTLMQLARLGKDKDHLKVVTIGGGTGLPTVLRGIQTYTASPTAIVAVTDTGAASGRIRWNLGVQPPGDIRNALTALSDRQSVSPGLARVFQHRFPDSEQKAGIFRNDNIGNFLVAALTQQLDDFQEAIRTACEMLNVKGTILPASNENVDICAELENGEHRYTEWMVRKPGKPPLKQAYLVANQELLSEVKKRTGAVYRVEDPTTGQVEIHARPGKTFRACRNNVRAPQEAVQAIAEADVVVLGPGSLYTSVITNLLVPEIREALQNRTHGITIFVCNITTQPGQTDGFCASEHLEALRRHLPDDESNPVLNHMLVQDPGIFRTQKGKVWNPLLKRYKNQGKDLVACDGEKLDGAINWTGADLVEEFRPNVLNRQKGDFISHDPHKVADAICRVFCGMSVPDYWGLENGESED
ncbi:MAG TPA: hypothetical protein DIU35_14175 [Candidatus Latescibacteria bacterium]|nr:hypothetical protein [Candidatus Latescibacterota bacterium]